MPGGAQGRAVNPVTIGIGLVLAGLLVSQGPLGDGGLVPGGGSASGRGAGDPPVRVVLPRVVDAQVVPVAATRDGALEVPKSPAQVGWWSVGAAPGSASGTVLLTGHVDSAQYGRGVFAALWNVPVGTRVTVFAEDGSRHRYRIVARRTYDRTALPANLFHGAREPRLALITCGGSFDRSRQRYSKNLVLYGVPTQT